MSPPQTARPQISAPTPCHLKLEESCQPISRSLSDPVNRKSIISESSGEQEVGEPFDLPRLYRLPATRQEPLINGHPNPLASAPPYRFISSTDSERNQQIQQAPSLARARTHLFGEYAKDKPLPSLPADEGSSGSSGDSQDLDDNKDFYNVAFGGRGTQDECHGANDGTNSKDVVLESCQKEEDREDASSWDESQKKKCASHDVVVEEVLPIRPVESPRGNSLLDAVTRRNRRRGGFMQYERAIIVNQTPAVEGEVEEKQTLRLSSDCCMPSPIFKRRRNAPIQSLEIQPISYKSATVLEPVKGAYCSGAFDLTDGGRRSLVQIERDAVAKWVPPPTPQVPSTQTEIRFFLTGPHETEPVEIFACS